MRRAIGLLLFAIFALTAVVSEAQQVTLIGVVTDIEGSPLENAIIEAYRDGSFIGSTRTLKNGYFSLVLPGTGTYEILAYRWGYERKYLKLDLMTTGTTNLGRITLDYALSVNLGTTYIVVDQGSTVELPLIVSNIGAFTILVNVSIDAPPEWSVALLSEQYITIRNLIMNPRDTRTLKVRIRVPGHAEGTNELTLVFSYANVTQRIPLTVETRYRDWELVVPFYSEVTSFAGSKFSIPLKIVNTLERSAVINVSVIPPRGWLARVTINGTQVTSLRLNPGENTVALLTVTLPENVEPGSYVIVLQAKALDIVSRSTVLVHVEPSYDRLEVEAQSQFVVTQPGAKVTIPLRITNDGTRSTIVSFAVSGLPTGYNWIVKDEYENILSAIVIPPKESRNVFLTIDIPQTASPTAVTFVFSAVGTNSSSKIVLGINIIGKPSINIMNQNWEIELTPGSSTIFQLLIENNGQIPLREISISLGNAPLGNMKVDVEPTRVLGLQPGGKAVFTLTVVANDNLEPGRYLIPLVISGEGIREERILAVNVRTGGGIFYSVLSLLVLVLALLAYLLTIRKLRGTAQ
ncbi:MAG: NEW3 domain-containing protein [Thermofilaceae archaeon]